MIASKELIIHNEGFGWTNAESWWLSLTSGEKNDVMALKGDAKWRIGHAFPGIWWSKLTDDEKTEAFKYYLDVMREMAKVDKWWDLLSGEARERLLEGEELTSGLKLLLFEESLVFTKLIGEAHKWWFSLSEDERIYFAKMSDSDNHGVWWSALDMNKKIELCTLSKKVAFGKLLDG